MVKMIKLIVYFGWLASLHSTSLYNPFVSPIYLPVNYITFLCWYLFWVFISFVIFLPLCWIQFHHFIFVFLLWRLEHFYVWYIGYCKVPISNIIPPPHTTPGVAPKCIGPPCLPVIPTKMPPGKRREGKFWAWNICCIWWESTPLKLYCTTAWIWW